MIPVLAVLIIVGVVLALVPMDETIRRVVLVIAVVLAVVMLLRALGIWF